MPAKPETAKAPVVTKTRAASVRYESNPFLELNKPLPVGTKNVRFGTLGVDDHIIINQKTGEEMSGGTHIIAQKRVDTAKFVKTFADYMAFTFDLSKAGNKALRLLMWAVQEYCVGKDMVVLDKYTHEEFLNTYDFTDKDKNSGSQAGLSYPTFTRGLAELESSKIIAKAKRAGSYYINPNCIFNGDRVAFTTVLERKRKNEKEELEARGQGRLDVDV